MHVQKGFLAIRFPYGRLEAERAVLKARSGTDLGRRNGNTDQGKGMSLRRNRRVIGKVKE